MIQVFRDLARGTSAQCLTPLHGGSSEPCLGSFRIPLGGFARCSQGSGCAVAAQRQIIRLVSTIPIDRTVGQAANSTSWTSSNISICPEEMQPIMGSCPNGC